MKSKQSTKEDMFMRFMYEEKKKELLAELKEINAQLEKLK